MAGEADDPEVTAERRDEAPMEEGGGHPVRNTGERTKMRAASGPNATKGYNFLIWIFVALLVAAALLAIVGGLFR